ncbi:MAG: MMPL family transporter [Firmicutes bacterium]|nr:MMPL family transporter [Bacillota bacterium]
MKTIARNIVRDHKLILILFAVLTAVSVVLMFQVNINGDLSKYLPESSPAKQGLTVINEEFSPASTFTLMFENLPADRKQAVRAQLSQTGGVLAVAYDDTEVFNQDPYTLYEITVDAPGYTPQSKAVVADIAALYEGDTIVISGDAAGNTAIERVPVLMILASVILLLILFVMSTSWMEPVLFVITIGVAIALNMGSNIIFGSVSEITYTIAAILQVCLSIDYSIMLLSRYRQEKETAQTKEQAMRRALRNGVTAISGSSITTIVGMLALTLMSFTIGMDLGLVLAKGVLISLLCILTLMPALVLIFDGALEKTRKKAFQPKMTRIGAFAHKGRFFILIAFVILLVGSFFLRSGVNVTYSLAEYNAANKHFSPANPIVVLYDNESEAAIAPALYALQADERIESVNAYATTMQREYTAAEFAALAGVNPLMASQLFQAYGQDSIPLSDLLNYIQTAVAQNPLYASMLPEGALEQLGSAADAFVGPAHSRALLNTRMPEEGDETFALLDTVIATLDETGAAYSLVGASPIAYELHESIPGEMNRITLLTVAAIFLIVALVFRKLTVPLILTLIIQCAVWVTLGTNYLQGISMYFMPMLIVQCLLLGSMVDYGILYADYYRKARELMNKKDAVIHALRSSIHTILTSGLVLVTVTAGIGFVFMNAEPSTAEILFTIAKGGFFACLLIVFFLPGVLAALDRGKEPEALAQKNE